MTDDGLLARFSANGKLDMTFGDDYDFDTAPEGYFRIDEFVAGNHYDNLSRIAIDANGGVYLIGSSSDVGSHNDFVAKFNSDGMLDTSFSDGDGVFVINDGKALHALRGLRFDSQGNLVIIGAATDGGVSDYDMAIWRIKPDGSDLDKTFGGGNGFVSDVAASGTGNDFGREFAIDSQGRYVVVGKLAESDSAVVWRYKDDGSIDTSFGDGKGYVTMGQALSGGSSDFYGVTIDGEGRIVAVGYAQINSANKDDMLVARFSDTGELDTTFGVDNDANGTPDGYVLHHGAASKIGGGDDYGLGVLIDAAGNIVVTGNSYDAENDSSELEIWRLLSDGSFDDTFGGDLDSNGVPDGMLRFHYNNGSSASSNGSKILKDEMGNLLVVGNLYTAPSEIDQAIWRIK